MPTPVYVPPLHPDLLAIDIEDFRAWYEPVAIRHGVSAFRANRVIDLVEQPNGVRITLSPLERTGEDVSVDVEFADFDGAPLRVQPVFASWDDLDVTPASAAVAAVLAYRARHAATDDTVGRSAIRARLERRERGLTEVEVTPPADGLYGTWLAKTAGVRRPGRTGYRVSLRSLSRRINGCTCPDFRTNRLGTCKHIEAARAMAARRRWAPAAGAALVVWPDASNRWHAGLVAYDPEWSSSLVEAPEAARWEDLPAIDAGGLDEADAKRLDRARARESRETRYLSLGPLKECATTVQLLVERDDVETSDAVFWALRQHVEQQERAARRRRWARRLESWNGEVPRLSATPFPYQREGIGFLVSRGRAMLADDMGLGKTLQSIAAMQWLIADGEVRQAMVVCPTTLLDQWKAEIERFTDLKVVVIEGGPGQRRELLASSADVLVTTYDRLRLDFEPIRNLPRLDLLIIDEAQRIKNWATRNARHVAALEVPFVFALTGTPLENRLGELHALIGLVDREVLGPAWEFFERFTVQGPRAEILGYRSLGELRTQLSDVLLRRERRQVLKQLPARTDTLISVPLGPAQRDPHDTHLSAARRLASIRKRRPLSSSERQRLLMHLNMARMACDSAALVDKGAAWRSPKLEALADLLDNLAEEPDTKIIVFSEWVRMGELAGRVAAERGLGWVHLHGSVPSKKRPELVRRFRDDPTVRVFVSSDAGGVGLNLQRASVLVHLDCPWNPAVMEQRTARVHRQGQSKSVRVYKIFGGAGTYERDVMGLVSSKQALFDAVLTDDAGDSLHVGEKQLDAITRQLEEADGAGAATASGEKPGAVPASGASVDVPADEPDVDASPSAFSPSDGSPAVPGGLPDAADDGVGGIYQPGRVPNPVPKSEPSRSTDAQSRSTKQQPSGPPHPSAPLQPVPPSSQRPPSSPNALRPRAAALLWRDGHHEVALELACSDRLDAVAEAAGVPAPAEGEEMAWLLGPAGQSSGLSAEALLGLLRAVHTARAAESPSEEALAAAWSAVGELAQDYTSTPAAPSEQGGAFDARSPAAAAASATHLVFRVSLRESVPEIWREFALPVGARFVDLSDAIQRAFGWMNMHLWEFRDGRRVIEGLSVRGTVDHPRPLADVFDATRRGTRCTYLYDFGDNWLHDVELVGVRSLGEPEHRVLLDGGEGAALEDLGGVYRLNELCRAFAPGADPDSARDWLEDEGLDYWLDVDAWQARRFDLEGLSGWFDGPLGRR